jgi:ribonucleoside-diphosphate reductase alpha chain
MTERHRLPNRRPSETFALECAGLKYTATISRFNDGRVGEIFLTNHKGGSHADTAARDAAITCSIALQFGADIETIRRALCRDGRGHASGPLGVALDLIAECAS